MDRALSMRNFGPELSTYTARPTQRLTLCRWIRLTEFSHFLESIILSAEPLVIVGDFNIHVDDANDPEAAIFLDLFFFFLKALLQVPNTLTTIFSITKDFAI